MHVVPKCPITGGAHRSALELATCLAKEHGIGVHFCVLAPRQEAFARMCGSLPVEFLGYGDVFNDWPDTWRCVRRLRALIQRLRPQVLHTHLWISSEIGAIASWGLGVPQVCHSRATTTIMGALGMRFKLHKFVTRMLLNRRRKWFVAVSDAVREHDCRSWPWLRNKCCVIKNAIDLQQFQAIDRDDDSYTARPDGQFVAGMIARFYLGKGHEVLLQAVSRLMRDRQNLLFRLAGTGPLEGSMRQLAEELRILPYIRFEGDVCDMPRFYREIDVLLFPATPEATEGLPRAVMEAKAAALPVIGSRVGGVEEAVTSGEDGLLVPPSDPDALALAIRQLMDDTCLRQKMAKQARANALVQFDVKRAAQEVMAVYENLLGQTGR